MSIKATLIAAALALIATQAMAVERVKKFTHVEIMYKHCKTLQETWAIKKDGGEASLSFLDQLENSHCWTALSNTSAIANFYESTTEAKQICMPAGTSNSDMLNKIVPILEVTKDVWKDIDDSILMLVAMKTAYPCK